VALRNRAELLKELLVFIESSDDAICCGSRPGFAGWLDPKTMRRKFNLGKLVEFVHFLADTIPLSLN